MSKRILFQASLTQRFYDVALINHDYMRHHPTSTKVREVVVMKRGTVPQPHSMDETLKPVQKRLAKESTEYVGVPWKQFCVK